MIDQKVLEGKWNEIQGRLKSRWGELRSDDLKQFDGNAKQLVGMIQQRTGEARESIEKYLEEVTQRLNDSSTVENVKEYTQHLAENAGAYASEASEAVQEGLRSAAASAKSGYQETEQLVRRHPVEFRR